MKDFKRQAFNPFLPDYEYVPDGEPHLFGDRVYLFGSHDKFNGTSFCLNDYVCWSAPADNLADWRYEGIIYRRMQDPNGKRGFLNALYAPDVCRGADGRYYLYYFLAQNGLISVAVCDTPAGKYEFLGHVRYPDGVPIGKKGEPFQFDPGVFVDDDGKIYLYTGFGPVRYPAILRGWHKTSEHGAMVFELQPDMLTVRGGFRYIGVKGRKESKGTPYENHEFFEASSMRKFNGRYYFIYSSYQGHELCYAVSDSPVGGFRYGGTLVSNGDIGVNGNYNAVNYTGNTHGSILELNGRYYVFYHRQTNRHQFSRQACAEEIRFADGRFEQAEMTSCGLNGGALKGAGEYGANIACNLYSKKGSYFYGVIKRRAGIHPYFTQSGKDRENNPDQYIANFCDGATAVFKYFILDCANKLSVTVRGKGGGTITVKTSKGGNALAEIAIKKGKGIRTVTVPFKVRCGKAALYFTYSGKGRVQFISFTLSE